MRSALASAAAMVAVAWRTSPTKMAIAVLLTLLGGASWPMLALALKLGTDAVVARDVQGAGIAGVLIGVAVIATLVLHHFAFVPHAEATEVGLLTLESELMRLANGSAGMEHHERPEYADNIQVLRGELPEFTEGMNGLMTALSLAVSVTITGVLLARLSPWLLLLPLAALPPVLAAQRAHRIVLRSRERAAAATRQANHLLRLATSAGSAKELLVYRLPAELRRRHADRWRDAGRTLWRGEWRAAALSAVGQLVFAVAYVGAVLLVLAEAVRGHSPIGDVVLVLMLAVQINQQVNAGLELLRRLQRMAGGMTRLRWLRSLIASRRPPIADAPVPDRVRRGIELRGVSFTYPGAGTPALRDVSVLLPAGATVAIVGENGAGKTTLVKLLCRFYEVTDGTITVDGVDLARLPVAEWRQRIAAGFQDFVRFELLARQSVGVGDLPDLDSVPAVRAALDRAGAADLVDQLPDGLDTQLGRSWTDGAELSGGQWQKLALGRAMMRAKPLLLILDEPTAALDAAVEHRLFTRYAENARRVGRQTGAITLLVSHRFSTVRAADLILVIADGRIAEAGDHATLLARGGLYAELYAIQAAAYG